ncbi:hypothetical protein DFH07DRAFT_842766 [Mycena maculata]|uniref:Oxidase ustYa n=1 Tax=Mycena maculata TaxID=230809 RepID=A0AAD7I7F4_9AGAR|nr:hypothetical protein DFH07DRAFT_842766 [Mycena maculata]
MPYPLRLSAVVYIAICVVSICTSFGLWMSVLRSTTVPDTLILGIHGAPRQATPYMDRPVQMMVEDSVRYRHPNNGAGEEFAKGFPPGQGAFPLEENNHATFVSMYHQLDCMDTFGRALTTTSHRAGWKRLQHCLNYLREVALCQADKTLEAGNFSERDFRIERQGAGHVCRDWEYLHKAVQSNWVRWRRVWNSEKHTHDGN